MKITEEDLKVARQFADALNHEPEESKPSLCPEKFHDVLTHRGNWRSCIVSRMINSKNLSDVSYWAHELRAFDRTFDLLEKEIGKDES